MTSEELYRWLAEWGCQFQPAEGGRLKVILGSRQSVIPMHGNKHDLNKGLVAAIKKQLGLK